MRSIRLFTGATAALILSSACGGDGGTPPSENVPPVAAFSEICTQLSCVFTDASTDADGTVTARSWSFGDGSPANQETSPTHVYATAGAKTVVLTVTDNDGATNSFSKTVTVTAGPANQPPVASFDLPTGCTAGTPCGFHSTSTDPDVGGSIAFTQWNFGDAGTGEGTDVTHTYAAAGTYTVVLTVTDNQNATGTSSQQLVVSPAASQDCTTSGTVVNCSFTPTARVTMKVSVVSTACELTGNRVSATAPRAQTVFFNLCNQPAGAEYTITDANGFPLVFEAGTPLALQFNQGTPGPNDPPTGDPGIKVTGSYPTWTLNIDDGGAPGTPGEPDFNDAVLTVQATLAP